MAAVDGKGKGKSGFMTAFLEFTMENETGSGTLSDSPLLGFAEFGFDVAWGGQIEIEVFTVDFQVHLRPTKAKPAPNSSRNWRIWSSGTRAEIVLVRAASLRLLVSQPARRPCSLFLTRLARHLWRSVDRQGKRHAFGRIQCAGHHPGAGR